MQIEQVDQATNQDYRPFCFIAIRSPLGFYYSFFLFICSVMILIVLAKKYKAIQPFGITTRVKKICILMIIQIVIFIVQYILGDIYYMSYLEYQLNPTPEGSKNQSIINYIFFIVGGFIIQWLFLLVTYNMTTNILDFYSQHGQIYPNKIMNLNTFFKAYFYCRFIRIVPILLLIFSFAWNASNSFIVITSTVCLALNFLDSLTCFCVMAIAYKIIIWPYIIDRPLAHLEQFHNMDEGQIKSFKNSCIYLILAALYRMVNILVILIVSTTVGDPDCPKQQISNIILILIPGQLLLKIWPSYYMVKLQFPEIQVVHQEI